MKKLWGQPNIKFKNIKFWKGTLYTLGSSKKSPKNRIFKAVSFTCPKVFRFSVSEGYQKPFEKCSVWGLFKFCRGRNIERKIEHVIQNFWIQRPCKWFKKFRGSLAPTRLCKIQQFSLTLLTANKRVLKMTSKTFHGPSVGF